MTKPQEREGASHGSTVKLYAMRGACSLASHIALAWTGAPYQVELLTHDAVLGKPYRRINPKAVVPTLVLDDGNVLTESLAILEYLAERYPRAAMGAADDTLARARLNERLSDLVSDVHEAWSPACVLDRYVALPRRQEEARQARFAELRLRYERLDVLMRDKRWLLFDRRTVADAYLYVMCCWQERTPTPLTTYPALARFKAQMDLDQGVRRALREEEIQ